MLDKRGRAEWDRIVPLMEQMGTLGQTDLALLATYCDTWSRWCASKKAMNKMKLAEQIRKLASELGLSPVSRTRLTVKEPPGVEKPKPHGIAAVLD